MLMLGVTAYQLYAGTMDMRKGIHSLGLVVQGELGRDPMCGEAFIFVGKRRNLLKVLVWKREGFWLCQCRLAQGRFRIPSVQRQDGQVCAVQLSAVEWQCLLDGVVVEQSRRLPRYAVTDLDGASPGDTAI